MPDLTPPRPSDEPATRKRRKYGSSPGPKVPPTVPRIETLTPDALPPVSDKTGLARSLYPHSKPARKYDVALLEELNEEYRTKPLVPEPRGYTSAALGADAWRRIRGVHNRIDLADKTVLEIGCGNGYEVWAMAHNLGADAHGIDVIQPNAWEDLVGDRVHLRCGDMAVENPYPEDYFDRIVSWTVWEHVVHPRKLLAESYKVMKPGGLQWLRANLWAGPKASHRYREIYFPWPHLLFSDDVIAEWDEKHGHSKRGSSWVNRLTWGHYERYIHDAGFILRGRAFDVTPIDWEFYERFEDILGRHPIEDLEKDFFSVILEKPRRRFV